MRGNAAILKCTIPSFVADFVSVVAWIDEEAVEYVPSKGNFSGGKGLLCAQYKPKMFLHISLFIIIYFVTYVLLVLHIHYFLNSGESILRR